MFNNLILKNMWINKEIPLSLAAVTAILNPSVIGNTIDFVSDKVNDVIDKGSEFIWPAAPLAQPLLAWLWGAKITEYWLDKIWIKSKLARYPLITTWAYLAITSSVAPYMAAWAWLYYGWKLGWKLWKAAVNSVWYIGNKINPFSKKSA